MTGLVQGKHNLVPAKGRQNAGSHTRRPLNKAGNFFLPITPTECCMIVSPWRVDAEQMTGVHVVSQPGRTRYQKQTDEALRIDRPTVWEG
jgi:hypothetical protein